MLQQIDRLLGFQTFGFRTRKWKWSYPWKGFLLMGAISQENARARSILPCRESPARFLLPAGARLGKCRAIPFRTVVMQQCLAVGR